ncbi:DUF1254 domain-containing protein [Propylenella binzhouense]|uniref:DUF1254 domain-containing protein n=1 Tax=Propylenella binzhouense TaxID=2555902 RepID=A0A964T8G8_9HYPH|nr:DUF1254 domain-containing protein [Propylenella binzhouense]MYZ50486.1 DUF1254 domain-containing protein [Propylenella binzhouense]
MIADGIPDMPRRRRTDGGQIAVALLAILLTAGVIHIVTILLVPRFATENGWSRLAAVAAPDGFALIGEGEHAVPGLDPLFVHGACRLDLSAAPAAISLSSSGGFWSMALYDPRGLIVFSLNDRTALEGQLDMLVVTPVQNAALKENPPPDIDRRIVVETNAERLIALLRIYAPADSGRDEATRILEHAECGPWAPPPAPEDQADGPT